MKAMLKVFSYKWYQSDSYFDKEIGNGNIIYALTGLIPEYLTFKDLCRKILLEYNYISISFAKRIQIMCKIVL